MGSGDRLNDGKTKSRSTGISSASSEVAKCAALEFGGKSRAFVHDRDRRLVAGKIDLDPQGAWIGMAARIVDKCDHRLSDACRIGPDDPGLQRHLQFETRWRQHG